MTPLSSLLLPMAFIGGGNMASALIGGLVKNGTPPSAIHVVEPFEATRQGFQAQLGRSLYTSEARAEKNRL